MWLAQDGGVVHVCLLGARRRPNDGALDDKPTGFHRGVRLQQRQHLFHVVQQLRIRRYVAHACHRVKFRHEASMNRRAAHAGAARSGEQGSGRRDDV